MSYQIARYGWIPDPLDYRDRSVLDTEVAERLARVLPIMSQSVSVNPLAAPEMAPVTAVASPGPLRVDLRHWCSPIEDQGKLGSCTAQAVVGALEYFERKTRNTHVEASRLFLYRVTRRYLGWDGRGDTGAFVRSAIKALRIFGTVPEQYWPYNEDRFDAEPEAFHYSFAQQFRALEYFRLIEDVHHLKSSLQSGLPFVFGFSCFSSLDEPAVSRTGIVPYPRPNDRMTGGHAVLAVGYTDSHLLFRNSWGTNWGDSGYGYLPWTYFDGARPLATDCWALLNATWIEPNDIAQASPAVASRAPVAAFRAPSERATALDAAAHQIEPLIAVVDGHVPYRAVPLRLTSRGVVAANESGPAPMATSHHPVALYLKSLVLKESFDWALFGRAVNELYIVAICWDLSGAPPVVFPAIPAEAIKGSYRVRKGEHTTFISDGIQLWPPRSVVGGLHTRILVMENDDNVRDLGQRMAQLTEVVGSSSLAATLAALVGGATAGTLTAVAPAATALAKAVAGLLVENGDDLVALFDGTYGAERLTVTRSERYDQAGVTLELELMPSHS